MTRPSDEESRRFLDYCRNNELADFNEAWAYAMQPKTPVTDAMIRAGEKAPSHHSSTVWLTEVYRAMRALEPTEPKVVAREIYDEGTGHRRKGEPIRFHRRKGD